jgi:hypothetical protein
MRANLELIKQRLFEWARERIARDYRFNVPATPEELSQQVLQSLGQKACANPLNQNYDNDAVFHAAVRTLGSNSRKWATFLSNEPKLNRILSGFRVEEVGRTPPNCFDLAKLLPGQTATADARAILNWAHLLSRNQNYYASVVEASARIQNRLAEREKDDDISHRLFMCVVAHFTNSSRGAQTRKWPGMGYVLGSEFLRNLHWNGFKPDRHIKRLLTRWTNDQIDVQQAIEQWRHVIGRKDRALSENLRLSLTGMEITPDDHKANFSQFDNLLWLLGAYVEKKGQESQCNYMLA